MDILVIVKKSISDSEKSEYQKKRCLALKRIYPNPVIMFMYTGDKNHDKNRNKYESRHPNAIVINDE